MFPTLCKRGRSTKLRSRKVQRTTRQIHSSDTALFRHISPKTNPFVLPGKPPSSRLQLKQRRAELDAIRAEHKKANADAKAAGFQTDWTLKCAVIVERPQVLVPERESWLQQYEDFYAKWNKPILAQYPPLQILDEDLSESKGKEKDKEGGGKEADATSEEKREKEEKEARMKAIREQLQEETTEKKLSRFTEADLKNDIKSVYRCLDKKLFLIVKKNRTDNSWQLPQGPLLPDEILKTGAERIFKSECNVANALQTYFVGNGPLYFHRYPYPKSLQDKLKSYGAKVFFMYSYYLDGKVQLDEGHLADYAWVTRAELPKYLSNDLFQALNQSIPHDGKLETRKKSMPNHDEPKYVTKGAKKKKK